MLSSLDFLFLRMLYFNATDYFANKLSPGTKKPESILGFLLSIAIINKVIINRPLWAFNSGIHLAYTVGNNHTCNYKVKDENKFKLHIFPFRKSNTDDGLQKKYRMHYDNSQLYKTNIIRNDSFLCLQDRRINFFLNHVLKLLFLLFIDLFICRNLENFRLSGTVLGKTFMPSLSDSKFVFFLTLQFIEV